MSFLDRHLLTLSQIENDSNFFIDDRELAHAVLEGVSYWQSSLKSLYMKGVDGAPDWLEYEHKIWQLGETLRLTFKAHRWKGKSKLLDACADILSQKRYGKGRQTFALLLGDFGRGEYGKYLANSVTDEDVQGHCIKALIKAKIRGFSKEVEVVRDNSSGWIKASAKKYIAKQ